LDIRNWLQNTIYMIPAILIAFTAHSYAQAAVADRLGDKNPRAQGRLTLNPLAHVDLIGFLMILIVQFGWGKPVETNPNAYKNYYKDDLKVRFSGIIANFIIAIIFAIIFGTFNKLYNQFYDINIFLTTLLGILGKIAFYIIQINCMFAIINIIPIPGLDGFHILRDLWPKFFFKYSNTMYKYQMIILIVFIIPIGNFSIAAILVGIPSQALTKLLITLVT